VTAAGEHRALTSPIIPTECTLHATELGAASGVADWRSGGLGSLQLSRCWGRASGTVPASGWVCKAPTPESRIQVARIDARIAGCALTAIAALDAPARAQQTAAPRTEVRAGVHAAVLATHASPMLAGAARTEAYVTQPTLMGELSLFAGALQALASVSLEPVTLDRGELGAGSYGEGYVDRRHPHTYPHEVMLTGTLSLPGLRTAGPVATSLALGRGYVPFGSDDPMTRPFVKFPVNHHLAQILERWVATLGTRAGPLVLEAALFSGTEPLKPTDWGALDRFGDSWAVRATALPATGIELQASFARVESPEMPRGGGWDQRKWSASARSHQSFGRGTLYALAEWKRTTVVDDGRDLFSFGSVLAEAELERGGWRPALRIERTERPEKERTFDPFRSPWPHADAHVLGITRWTIVGVRLQRDVALDVLRLAPFLEASHARVIETAGGPFDPQVFYGGRSIWTVNAGVRLGAGAHRPRMGRYGVAAAAATADHAH
jgi:hypothetical protein